MKIKKFFKENQYTDILLILMAVVMIFFTITKPGTFWSLGTWKGIVMQFPEYGVMTIGVMFCFLIGCIDMSFVMLGNFAMIIGVKYMLAHTTEGMSNGQMLGVIAVGLLIAIVIAAIGGVINGLLISKLGIPPVIATISMQMVWLGLSTGITKGQTLSLKTLPIYAEIGHSTVLGFIPFPLFIFIIVFIIAALVLRFTVYGKKLYMCGTNLKAAKFSAVNTDRMIIVTFVICDIVCLIGSMMMTSTLNSVKADNGEAYVMKIILILVLSGILPDGGIGKIGNMIFSVLIIQMITSGVNMFKGLNTYHGSFIYGTLLVIVLILSTYMDGKGFKFLKGKKKTS
ncbi:MAG: ABC transporter permease [Eubacteriales bacterium]|nr:ABC transporter permease [Eubacteriales bacterium]